MNLGLNARYKVFSMNWLNAITCAQSAVSGNRVTKYEQRFCNSEFGDLKPSAAEVAVITTLLLRGAQHPGELRTRASCMHEFADMQEVEQTLDRLATREDGPLRGTSGA